MAITTSGTKHGSIPHDFIFHPPMIFKSPPNLTSSKRTKSSLSSTFLPKSRVRTKFRPSKAPHYYYTALPNNSFVSEPDDPPGRSSPPPTTTSSPWHRSTPAFSLTLENSGSVARDHLASERTFLAYTRTSLALTSAGVGMFQVICILGYC
jgi:hypothetical protein